MIRKPRREAAVDFIRGANKARSGGWMSPARTPERQIFPKFRGGASAGRRGKGAGGQQAEGPNPQAGRWTFSKTGGAFGEHPASSTTGLPFWRER